MSDPSETEDSPKVQRMTFLLDPEDAAVLERLRTKLRADLRLNRSEVLRILIREKGRELGDTAAA